MIIASSADFATLYPPAIINLPDMEVVDQVFIRLADLDTSLNTVDMGAFVPRLARTWEFEDELTLRFDLDPDAKWHDGTAVTAEDVVFTLEAYRDPATNSSSRTLIDRIDSVTARDEHTAVFTFSHAYVEQFFDATHYMRILPRHRLDSIAPAERRNHAVSMNPVGSGPFRFRTWVPNQRLELVAVEDYFEGPPGIARLIWQTLPADQQALDALASEQIDIVAQNLGRNSHERIAAMDAVTSYPYPSAFYVYLGLNLADPADGSRPHPLFADRALRRAIAAAVDRQTIMTALLGDHGELPDGPAPPLVRTSALHPTTIPFDLEGARRELTRLGWVDTDDDGVRERRGTRLAFDVITPSTSGARRATAVIMQEQLAAAGVQLIISEIPYDPWLARSEAGEFSSYLGNWGVDPSPSAVRGLWTQAGFSGTNWSHYYNPTFDRLVDEARNATDQEREVALWEEAYSVFNQDAAVILLYTPYLIAGIHERFENVTIRGDLWATTLWTWRVRRDATLPRDHIR